MQKAPKEVLSWGNVMSSVEREGRERTRCESEEDEVQGKTGLRLFKQELVNCLCEGPDGKQLKFVDL